MRYCALAGFELALQALTISVLLDRFSMGMGIPRGYSFDAVNFRLRRAQGWITNAIFIHRVPVRSDIMASVSQTLSNLAALLSASLGAG